MQWKESVVQLGGATVGVKKSEVPDYHPVSIIDFLDHNIYEFINYITITDFFPKKPYNVFS